MRKNVRNDKVVRAITIGLATMIAATSMPVNVWADDDVQDAMDGGAETTETSIESNEVYNESIGAAEQAESQAESAVEEVAGTEDNSGSSEENVGSVEAAVEALTNGDSAAGIVAPVVDEGGQVAQNSVNEFIAAIDPNLVKDPNVATDPIPVVAVVVKDEDGYSKTDNYDSAVQVVKDAQNEIKAVGTDLKATDNADRAADESAKEAVDTVAAVETIAANAAASVDSATKEANGYIETINSATATEAEKEKAFEDLNKLTENTKTDIDTKKKTVAELGKSLEKAKESLKIEEENFNTSLRSAGMNVGNAKSRLEAAQDYVGKLEEAYEKAQTNLAKENVAATNIVEKQNAAIAKNWNTLSSVMKSVVSGYIIPQIIGVDKEVDYDSIEVVEKKEKGLTTQNSSRYVFKYSDKDGEHTLYFNYDMENRKIDENNEWADLGNSKNIVIYQRTEEEVAADKYAEDYFIKIGKIKANPDNRADSKFKESVKNGEFDVFVFEDNEGKKIYKTRDELGLEKGNDNAEFDGMKGRKVVQSTSKTDGIYKIDVANNKDLQEFIKNAQELTVKYAKYNERIKNAKEDVEDAVEKTEALEEAIKNIDGSWKNRIGKAAIAGIQAELGDRLSDEDIARLNDVKSTAEAIAILDEIYSRAIEELEVAEANLNKLVEKRDEIKDKLDDKNIVADDNTVEDDVTTPTTGGGVTTPTTGGTATVTDAPSGEAGTVFTTGGYTYTIPAALSGVDFSIFGGTAATVTAPTAGGVAGVREDAAGEIGGGAIEEAGEENEEGSEETVNPVEDNKIKNIDEGKVPLAAAPPIEEGLMINWWWFLVILLLGETGKKMYDDHMMKVKAREEADRAN